MKKYILIYLVFMLMLTILTAFVGNRNTHFSNSSYDLTATMVVDTPTTEEIIQQATSVQAIYILPEVIVDTGGVQLPTTIQILPMIYEDDTIGSPDLQSTQK